MNMMDENKSNPLRTSSLSCMDFLYTEESFASEAFQSFSSESSRTSDFERLISVLDAALEIACASPGSPPQKTRQTAVHRYPSNPRNGDVEKQ
jgi:hypothetical protein